MRTALRISMGVVLLAAPLAARGGEAGAPSDARDAAARTDEPAKPLCLVKVTDTDGLPLAPMALLRFEQGVYHLRAGDGRDHEIAEDEVKSVVFLPLEKPARAKRGESGSRDEREANGVEGDGRTRADGPRGDDEKRERRELEAERDRRLLAESRPRFVRLKRVGGLDREIRRLERALVASRSATAARNLIRQLVVARGVQTEKRLTADEIYRAVAQLVKSVEDAKVREELKNQPSRDFVPLAPGVHGRRWGGAR